MLLEKVLGVFLKLEKYCIYSIYEIIYDIRIEVVNYVLVNDDGFNLKDYDEVDIIFIGVLCLGKMLISFYLVF